MPLMETQQHESSVGRACALLKSINRRYLPETDMVGVVL